MNRHDFRRLALLRLKEARSLLKGGHYSGAYYVGGYVVECALKACIARLTKRHDFPDKKTVNDSYTHSLTKLVETAGLRRQLDSECKNDPQFDSSWATVQGWSEESRYGHADQVKAEAFLRSITDSRHGVLRWLRRYW